MVFVLLFVRVNMWIPVCSLQFSPISASICSRSVCCLPIFLVKLPPFFILILSESFYSVNNSIFLFLSIMCSFYFFKPTVLRVLVRTSLWCEWTHHFKCLFCSFILCPFPPLNLSLISFSCFCLSVHPLAQCSLYEVLAGFFKLLVCC